MRNKIFKILTLLSYCLIIINGGHLGGPLILFLLLGLTNSGLGLLYVGILWVALFGLLYTVYRPNVKTDKIVIPIILSVLWTSLLLENGNVFRPFAFRLDPAHIITMAIFFTLSVILILLTFRQQKIKTADT
jgi:hypothetical protein